MSARPERRRPPDPPDQRSREWRRYFLALLNDSPRFAAARRFLAEDILAAMRRLVPDDARVLEVGVGSGRLLAGLPNQIRHGIDALPEAVELARSTDPRMRIELSDALDFAGPDRYDAILCDRLCHTVSDVQRLLENLVVHLSEDGRIYLTCFNFLWGPPLAAGEKLGLHEPSPPGNWFSESTWQSLFTLVGLEAVHTEDRLLLPARVPGLTTLLNRYGAKLPGIEFGTLYRVYVLRRRVVVRAPLPSVTVVVPARNEAGNIAAAVERTPLMGQRTEIIFVEGGSTDGTWERIQEVVARYRGPLELKALRQTGKGKADAVRLGFDHASGDILMILDADLTVPPEDLPKFYRALCSGVTDYVHGTRMVYPMEEEAMRFLNKLGNAFFARTFSYLLGQPIKDTLCGTKVLWREDYAKLARNRRHFGDFDPFGDFDLIFGANKLHLKMVEIPVRYRNRTYGETNISRFRHGLLLLRMTAFAARKIKFV